MNQDTAGGDVPNRRGLTFAEASSRSLTWLIAGLVAWLCLSTMNMQKQMAIIIERSDQSRADILLIRGDQQQLHAADQLTQEQLKFLQIKQAEHGWR